MRKLAYLCVVVVVLTAWTMTRSVRAQAIPMWICTPANAAFFQGSGYVANITCSDGQGRVASEQVAVPGNPSATWAGDAVQQFIAQLTAQQTNIKSLPAPGMPIAPSAVIPPVNPPPPTGFVADYPQYQQCSAAVAQGLTAATDSICGPILTNVPKEFQSDEANQLANVAVR